MMEISNEGINLIKVFEQFRSKPYQCPAGVWTIGYGSTFYTEGQHVTSSDAPISEQVAEVLLATTLIDYENSVNKMVKIQLNQNQFDALVDFAYNCGSENLKSSTLLKKVNATDFNGAALEFDKWVHANGKVLAGLVYRRAAEKALFLS